MIYFDSAATTLQKPESVYAAVQRTMRACASVGRGGHAAADAAARVVYACRTEAAELFDAAPEQVVFTMNATHGLEYCPCAALSGRAGASCCPAWSTMPSRGRLRRSGRRLNGRRTAVCAGAAARGLCARPAAGSGCGGVHACFKCLRQCAARVSRCRAVPGTRRPARHRCLAVRGNAAGQPARDGAAFIAMPGHKGLYGPQGRACCCAARRGSRCCRAARGAIRSIRACRISCRTATRRARTTSAASAACWLACACARAAAGRAAGGGARTHGPCGARPSAACRAWRCSRGRGRAAFCRSAAGTSTAREAAARLAEAGIAVRAGLHCAPMAHRSGGTLETGTVRVSFSAF